MIGHEEDETCGRDGCDGVMEPSKVAPDGCYCHASPPCELCVNAPARCSKCGASAGDVSHEPAETQATLTAPPDVIARQMGPEVTAWIADVLHQWHTAQVGKRHAESEAAAEKATREYITNQLCECAADRDAARKALDERRLRVAELEYNLADALRKNPVATIQIAGADTESRSWIDRMNLALDERDAATKRAQIAEGELTKTRGLYTEAAKQAETALARIAGMETTLENALANPLSLFPKTPRLRVADMGQFGSGEAFVGVIVPGQNSHDATLNAIVALAKSIQP